MKECTKRWHTFEIPPGYKGSRKTDIDRARDKVYGKGNWRDVWEARSKHGFSKMHYLSNKGAVRLYEDAYYQYFKKNPEKLEWISGFKDVYDNSETNVGSGLDYSIQESNSTHLQDISIRRCMVRLGMQFKGKDLLQIRSIGPGAAFGPGNIPFHLSHMMPPPELELKGWWKPGSIESFYQSNRRLQVREKAIWGLNLCLTNIIFATGNKGKFESAKKAFGDLGEKELALSLDQMDLGTSEPYSDVMKNAKHKALVAFATLCHECICDDSALVVPALGGWPGANVKRVLQEMGLEAFLRRLDGTNREAYFHQVLVYADRGGELHFFEEKGEMGIFADKPRGTLKPWHKSELMGAFIPASERPKPEREPMTVAERDENKPMVRPGRYREFAEFYHRQEQMRFENFHDPDEADDYERGRK